MGLPMRLVLSLVAVLALAGYRGGCDSVPYDSAPYDPCAGKACGEGCRACAPDDADCVETTEVKACDPSGRCASAGTFACDASDDCSGKACGAPCTYDPPCTLSDPPCMMPSQAGSCDGGGRCWPAETPPDCAAPPPWGCDGKACGESCGYCPPGTDPAYCPVPTFAPTACDRLGNCVTATSWLCYDPCAGKVCGDPCDACPPGEPCPMTAVVTACNTTGACVPMTSGMCGDPVTG